jgi:CHAT domain-containing protein
MHIWAMMYLASAILQQGRLAEAGVLHRQIDAEMKSTYQAAAARLLLEIALREGLQGHWSASLDAALQSMSISRALGEQGNTAAAEAIVSADYDFLGQPALARQHGFAALANAAAMGDFERTRVILGALSRMELRGRRWQWAHAIQQLEIELADVHRDPGLDADLWMTRAACESRLGHRRAAADALSRARGSAMQVPSPTRDRLLGDIDGIEGTLMRTEDPLRAWTLLSSAIGFQRRATRPILLPQLYLARGRTALQLGRLLDASSDFEDGIRELERQRTYVDDAALRPGIFDDAAELFDEALSLQLRSDRNPSTALTIVERGRARTLLEQMAGRSEVRRLAITEIQRRLNRTTAIVEFATLPDRLVTFVITRHGVIQHQRSIPREQLLDLTSTFLSQLSSGRDIRATRDQAAALHGLTIAPVARHLAGIRHIAIVPDNTLERVPFAALVDRRSTTFLIEQFTISTSPSASVFATIVQRRPNRRLSSVAIFANPLSKDSERFPSLHAAELESRIVGRSYRQVRLLTGRQATADQFLETASEADVLHFAGHAYVNRSIPAESALVLSDGMVTVREIARMNFSRTGVIVLAACSTMRGRNAAVEGVPSLANAFISAGAGSVIGTLWDINDGAAAPVIAAFHKEVSAGVPSDEALRAAQTKSIRAGHPVGQWAALAVTGR